MSLETADPFAGIEPDRLAPVPQSLFETARRQFMLRPVAKERRRSPRHYIAAEAVARPLDAGGAPAGEAFRGVVTDLSSLGVRILHTDFVAADRLAVRIELWSGTVTAVLRVNRVVHADDHVEYAGPFVEPIELDALVRGER